MKGVGMGTVNLQVFLIDMGIKLIFEFVLFHFYKIEIVAFSRIIKQLLVHLLGDNKEKIQDKYGRIH